MKKKVLIADDSALYRKSIRSALEGVEWIEAMAPASNGRIAIDRMSATMPDLLILDMEMPEMGGLDVLREMKRLGWTCPVIVFSSASKTSAESTLEALSLGAKDFITKPGGERSHDGLSPAEKIGALLLPKVKEILASSQNFERAVRDVGPRGGDHFKAVNIGLFTPQIVLIGSSTGGPTVLERIFSHLSPHLNCPIVIVQHMPPIFTTSFAERLSRVSGLKVAEAIDGEKLQSGRVYLAPGDYHVHLRGQPGDVTIALNQDPPIHFVRPAVDPLFQSAAAIFGSSCLGFVLTGMGSDGREGARAIKEKGGLLIIQNKETCVVFGMPGAVCEIGAYDREMSPDEIIALLNEKVSFESMPVGSCG